MAEIQFASLETVFLDLGNTLISMDYVWIRDELAREVVDAELPALMRAEAAARPATSRTISGRNPRRG